MEPWTAVIAHADEIKGKIGENLRAHLDQLPLSNELATIKCDLDLETSLDELEIQPADKDALYDWYRELEFGTWLRQLQGDTTGS